MTTIYEVEGFDTHSAGTMISVFGWFNSGNYTTTTGLLGDGLCLRRTAGSGGSTDRSLPSTYSTLVVGFRFRLSTLSATRDIMGLETGVSAGVGPGAFRIQLTTGGLLRILNSGGTVIATGTTVITANSIHYIEAKAVIAGASGSCKVYLDGALEIDTTTGNFGSTNLGAWLLPAIGTGGPTADYDDVYFADDFLGYVPRVFTGYPSAAGAHTQWTPDSGANYARVQEIGPNDADTSYVKDNTAGHYDTYAHDALPSGVATVTAVKLSLIARKDDAALRQVAPVIRQSGVDYDGTTVTMAETYVRYGQVYNTQPAGGAWTPSAVDAAEIGEKLVT